MPFENQRLVLVVDDENYVIEVFERAFLGQTRFVLDVAKTVEMALEKIRSAVYDVIFLDMKLRFSMAGMRVLEELRQMEIERESERQQVLHCDVVIMSGSTRISDFSQKAHSLDVFTFIDKPHDFNEAFVRRVCSKLRLPLLPRKI